MEVRGQSSISPPPSCHSVSCVLSQDLSLELELADSSEQIISQASRMLLPSTLNMVTAGAHSTPSYLCGCQGSGLWSVLYQQSHLPSHLHQLSFDKPRFCFMRTCPEILSCVEVNIFLSIGTSLKNLKRLFRLLKAAICLYCSNAYGGAPFIIYRKENSRVESVYTG